MVFAFLGRVFPSRTSVIWKALHRILNDDGYSQKEAIMMRWKNGNHQSYYNIIGTEEGSNEELQRRPHF